MGRAFTILVAPDKRYPLEHALLDHIFCRILPSRGHKVLWLMPSREARRFDEHRLWRNTELYLTPSVKSDDRRFQLEYLLYTKPRSKMQIMKIVRERNVDIIFVRNDLHAAIAAFLTSRKFKVPFIYYLAFPIQEASIEQSRLGQTRSRHASRIYFRFELLMRNWITRRANFVFTMSEYWRGEVIRNLGISGDRVKALPFGFDANINTKETGGSYIRNKFNLNGHPVILYIGTIGPPRNVDILVDIMAKVKCRIPEARLLILVGLRQERFVPDLKRKFEQNGLSRQVVFAPSVPHHEVQLYIAAADVGLSPIERNHVYDVSSPAKFVEMLGMGLPVVASDTPEQKQVLDETKAGICVPFRSAEFSDGIAYILENPREAIEMGKRGRQFVKRERSFLSLAKVVEKVLVQCVERRNLAGE